MKFFTHLIELILLFSLIKTDFFAKNEKWWR